MPEPFAIEFKNVWKSFGQKPVLSNLDFKVDQHSVFAFLGNNGAGKSTTIRLLTGLLQPDKGHISILGLNMQTERRRILHHLGCIVDAPSLYPQLNAVSFLKIAAIMKDLAHKEIHRVLELVRLQNHAKVQITDYSLGMKQRLALAHALMGSPKLIILDEPTNGLDPEGIQDIRSTLRLLPSEADCTVFLSTHNLSEAEKIATHLAVLNSGKIQYCGDLGSLMSQHNGRALLRVDDAQKAASVLRAAGYDAHVLNSCQVRIHEIGDTETDRVNVCVMAQSIRLFECIFEKPNLESWFLNSTKSSELP